MAFRQPTYHAPQRVYNASEEAESTKFFQPSQELEESHEWVLFSPAAASTTQHTTSTERTRRTAGRSRLSDYGSLDTAARSYEYDDEGSAHTEGVVEDEEDGELDSLDSHLHEFRAESSVYRDSQDGLQASGNPVLPTHDGLGSFRIDKTAMGEGVQEHLYAFERYNPKSLKRRRQSLEFGQLELESERLAEYETIRRIEEWRLEQSRALLEEILNETRRRRQSMSTDHRSLARDTDEEELATMGSVDGADQAYDDKTTAIDENDGFWTRITRRVIEDLMGIDDSLLSIIFGETLPDADNLSAAPPTIKPHDESWAVATNMADDSWEYRLLNRIARELGLLVNQLSDHPGAFSTYLRMRQMPLPYAGLPIIPESIQDTSQDPAFSTSVASTPQFLPTIPAQPLNIAGSARRPFEVADEMDATPRAAYPIHRRFSSDNSLVEFTKAEWEKQLDIKMVFRYLRSRFTSRPSSPLVLSHGPSNLATSSPQDAAARAARVRQHHPLVTRQMPVEKRTYRVTIPGSPILHRRSSSGCASQSTRKSAKRNSGSSRHYWDINGSIGSGSLIASTGGMGSWGEV